MTRIEELGVKLRRCRALIEKLGVSALWLQSRANFSWITLGGQNYVNAHSEGGVGSVIVTADRLYLLADNIEIDRLAEEELGDLAGQFELLKYDWFDKGGAANQLADVCDPDDVAGDTSDAQVDASAEIMRLRYELTDAEIERYRTLGLVTASLTEQVCRAIRPGVSEHEVAGKIFDVFAGQGARVPVYLVAADDRIETRRHPIVTEKRVEKRVMVVVCAEREGLWVNLTRLVNFEPVSDDLAARHRACCEVDAAANAATRPGRTLGEIFADIQQAYAEQGHDGEWRLHHQGGSTGYQGRDVFATPGEGETVAENQAFAWNPSITGTKSEDTILVGASGFEFLCEPGADWPVIEIERDGRVQRRADILVQP